MSSNCGLRDGVVHAHSERCYQAGAVEALRRAADRLLDLNFANHGAGCLCVVCGSYVSAAAVVRDEVSGFLDGAA